MRALAALFPTVLVGCIFVVSPEEYGTTCRFQGEDTQCGACIATSCRAELNACCRDEACEQPLRDLDDCATRSSYACNTLRGVTIPAVAGPLAQCVDRACGAVCFERKGTSTTSCREPRLGEGSACECAANGEVNDFVCTPQAFPNAICCAPKGWPAPGLECSCRPLDCNPSPDGCFCRLVDFTPKQRECEGATKCCVYEDTCTCRPRGCSSFEREVDSCAVDALDCAAGQERVESCSLRTP